MPLSRARQVAEWAAEHQTAGGDVGKPSLPSGQCWPPYSDAGAADARSPCAGGIHYPIDAGLGNGHTALGPAVRPTRVPPPLQRGTSCGDPSHRSCVWGCDSPSEKPGRQLVVEFGQKVGSAGPGLFDSAGTLVSGRTLSVTLCRSHLCRCCCWWRRRSAGGESGEGVWGCVG